MKFKDEVKGDLILVVVLLIMGAGVLVYSQMAPGRSPGRTVLVEIDGNIVQELPLDRDLAGLRFETDRGYNIVEIKDGSVRVTEADCPDLLCVHTGWRRHVGQVIICLPHRFVVRVMEEGADQPDLDSFTY